MKKILLACLIAGTSLCGSAQIIRSTSSERTLKVKTEEPVVKSWNHSGLFLNTGIGVLTGDADTDFAWEFGWGYRWHITSGISWEVFRLGFDTGVSHFKDMFNLRFTTGVRYDTPRFDFLKGKSLYANFNLGYGIRPMADESEGGFVYEIGAGIKLNRKCSVGLFYQGNKDSYEYSYYIPRYGWEYEDVDLNWGMFGIKIEYQFR